MLAVGRVLAWSSPALLAAFFAAAALIEAFGPPAARWYGPLLETFFFSSLAAGTLGAVVCGYVAVREPELRRTARRRAIGSAVIPALFAALFVLWWLFGDVSWGASGVSRP